MRRPPSDQTGIRRAISSPHSGGVSVLLIFPFSMPHLACSVWTRWRTIYAVTSHSSQSKTVDDVLLVASSRSFAAVNREQFYVSISRGRKHVQVFTDDAELLSRRVTDSHERKAAVELQGLRDDLAKLGLPWIWTERSWACCKLLAASA